MTIRSFIAINLEPELKQRLNALILPLKKDLSDFRIIEAENIHLTLRFLGHITPEELVKSQDTLYEIARSFSPFTLEFKGLMAFPSFSRGRILGVKVRNSQKLNRLFTEINSEFNQLEIGREEKREFKPHLTWARAKNREKTVSFLQEVDFTGTQSVKSLELMKSHLSPSGARYKLIKSFSLCQK